MCSTRLLTVCGQMMKRGTIRGQAEWRFSLFLRWSFNDPSLRPASQYHCVGKTIRSKRERQMTSCPTFVFSEMEISLVGVAKNPGKKGERDF